MTGVACALDGARRLPWLAVNHCASSAVQPSSIIVSFSVHVKRDAAGVVKRRSKRTEDPRRKRVASVLDNDLGEVIDSGDETDLAEEFGLSAAFAAPPTTATQEDLNLSEMSLGVQGDALLAAINASLGTKIDGVASQVAQVANRV